MKMSNNFFLHNVFVSLAISCHYHRPPNHLPSATHVLVVVHNSPTLTYKSYTQQTFYRWPSSYGELCCKRQFGLIEKYVDFRLFFRFIFFSRFSFDKSIYRSIQYTYRYICIRLYKISLTIESIDGPATKDNYLETERI